MRQFSLVLELSYNTFHCNIKTTTLAKNTHLSTVIYILPAICSEYPHNCTTAIAFSAPHPQAQHQHHLYHIIVHTHSPFKVLSNSDVFLILGGWRTTFSHGRRMNAKLVDLGEMVQCIVFVVVWASWFPRIQICMVLGIQNWYVN